MSRFPIQIIMAILISPALATPVAAAAEEIISDQNNIKISEPLNKAINTIKNDFKKNTNSADDKNIGREILSPEDKNRLQLEADALEKQAIEKSLVNTELKNNTELNPNKEVQPQVKNPEPKVEESKNTFSNLISMEQFKVCSLGHNYKINGFEFIKHSQVTQAATIMKFTSASNPNYQCEMMVISKDKQEVSLKCWHGNKYNESVSTFKLSYFFNNGYLFSQSNKAKLVYIKPIVNNQDNNCPKNFKPVVNNISEKNYTQEQNKGLAGLTF